MKKKKLTLNKERVTKLTKNQSAKIIGGGSTEHRFTCGWCTNLDGDDDGDDKNSWETCRKSECFACN